MCKRTCQIQMLHKTFFLSYKKLQHSPRFCKLFLNDIEKNHKESQDSDKTITKFKNSFIITITNRLINCHLNSTRQKERRPKGTYLGRRDA